MSKRKITIKELHQMQPEMPEAFAQRGMQTLHSLQNPKEEPVVKRKISFSLALALVIMLVAVVAVAATILWENYAVQVKQTEQEQGYYQDWFVENKIDLVKTLVDMGYIAESEETTRLCSGSITDEEAHAIADELITNLTKMNLHDVNLMMITESLWGGYETWTLEQKAWWQSIVNMDGAPASDAVIMVTPSDGDLSENEAIEIAKKTNIETFGYSNDYFDGDISVYTELYVTAARPDFKRWYVEIIKYDGGDEDNQKRFFAVMDSQTGEVIADPDRDLLLPKDAKALYDDTPVRPTNDLFKAIDEFYVHAGYAPFWEWPLELRAEYSQEINPMVKAIVDSGDLTPLVNGEGPDISVMASATYTYGLPSAQDIPQDEALALATTAVKGKYKLDDDAMGLYTLVSTYYDITNPEKPLWKFVFRPDTPTGHGNDWLNNKQYDLRYKVEMDAHTGEIVRAEEFEFEPLGDNLEYDLKWY